MIILFCCFLTILETKEGAMLKIIRLSAVASSVNGGEEVWLLADKLNGLCVHFVDFSLHTQIKNFT